MTDAEMLKHVTKLAFGSYSVEFRARRGGENLYVVKDAWLSQYVYLPDGSREEEFLPDLRTEDYRRRTYMPLAAAAELAKLLDSREEGAV